MELLKMGDRRKRIVPPNNGVVEEEDRISSLPDELIHKILWFLDAKVAVETCILSKRWTNIWKTLSYLKFDPSRKYYDEYNYLRCYNWSKFVSKFLKNRDKKIDTSSVEINISGFKGKIEKQRVLNYAISHNIKHLKIANLYTIYYLSFPVLESLRLERDYTSFMYWSLPSLTTLYLKRIGCHRNHIPLSFEGFPNLKILTLDCLVQYFDMEVLHIKSHTLTTLTICQWIDEVQLLIPAFMISAPKLSSFSYYGNYLSLISSEAGSYPCLQDLVLAFDFERSISWLWQSQFTKLLTKLREFNGVNFLTLSFQTLDQVFSRFPQFWPSPFRNLKTLHLVGPVSSDRTVNLTDSVIPTLRYLLNSSPQMKIFVKDCGGKIKSYNPDTDVLNKKKCGYCKVKSKRNASLDSQTTANIQVNGDEPQRVLEVMPPALVPRAVNDESCSLNQNSSLSLPDVTEIDSEYVDLLNRIKEEHPETFEHFKPQTEFIYTWGLNALCRSVKAFYEESKVSLTISGITRYRALFADLETWGFNTMWLVTLLNNADKSSC